MKAQRKEQSNNKKVQPKEQLMKKKKEKVQFQPKQELNDEMIQPQTPLVAKVVQPEEKLTKKMKEKVQFQPKQELNDEMIQQQTPLVAKVVQPKEQLTKKMKEKVQFQPKQELNDEMIQQQTPLVAKVVQPEEKLNEKKLRAQMVLAQQEMRRLKTERLVRFLNTVELQIIFDDMLIPAFQAVLITQGGREAKASVPAAGIPVEDIVGGIMDVAFSFNQKVCPTLVNKDVAEQAVIDKHMTEMVEQQLALECENSKLPWKSKQSLFRNAMFAVSMAVCKVAASYKKLPLFRHIANLAGNEDVQLPVPAYNVMKAHSHPTNKLAVQEYILLPVGTSSMIFAQFMDMNLIVRLKKLYSRKFGQDASVEIDYDCFFANKIQDMKEGLEILNATIDESGLSGKVVIGVDVAASASSSASSSDKVYALNIKDEKNDSERENFDLFKQLESFVRDYHVMSIKDPFRLDDLELYSRLTTEVGHGQQVEIIGDGLVQLTNLTSIKSAIEKRTCNALHLKMNDIGSVTECISAVQMTKQAGWSCILATFGCGCGDTTETSYADLSVGLAVDQVRFGSIDGNRTELYARFDEIQELLCGFDQINVPYAGKKNYKKEFWRPFYGN